METFTAYLIKSVIWLTGFALVYFLFLQNERFFLLKRFYLIAGLVFSFVFPLVTIHYKIDIPVSEGIHPGMTAILSGQGSMVQNSDSGGSIGFKHILLF